MNSITQRRGFETRAYNLDPDGEFVEVRYNSLKEKLRFKIHLSEVGNEIQYEADNLIAGKIVMVVMSLLAISCAAYYFLGNPEKPGLYVANSIVWGTLAILGLIIPNKDDIVVGNGSKVIRLFRNKPNEEQVIAFANLLIRKANEKKKEMLINFELNEEQFAANMHWLYSMRLIDKAELEQLHSDYNLKKLI